MVKSINDLTGKVKFFVTPKEKYIAAAYVKHVQVTEYLNKND